MLPRCPILSYWPETLEEQRDEGDAYRVGINRSVGTVSPMAGGGMRDETADHECERDIARRLRALREEEPPQRLRERIALILATAPIARTQQQPKP